MSAILHRLGRLTFEDRTIMATAAALNLTLITTDPAIRDAGECAIEYYPFKRRRPKPR